MQGGMKKGNVRERSALGKVKKDGQDSRKVEEPKDSSDSSRYIHSLFASRLSTYENILFSISVLIVT